MSNNQQRMERGFVVLLPGAACGRPTFKVS